MNYFEQCYTHDDKFIWETLIKPEYPEQPLILVKKERDAEYFEALFALELTGVTRQENNQQTSEKSEEKDVGEVDRNHHVLLSSLSANQQVNFIHSSVKDEQRNAKVQCRITGHARGETFEKAAESAAGLWQNLNVVLGTMKNEYCFATVTDAEKLIEEDFPSNWVGVIRPLGIEVDAGRNIPVGFRQNDFVSQRASLVVVPDIENKQNHHFDAVVNGSAGCPNDVKVIISVTPHMLSGDELEKIALAMKWLRNGEKKQIRYYQQNGEGVEDEKVITGLQNALNNWMKNPYGFRVSCIAISDKPIPSSFLSLIGGEIFSNSSISIKMYRRTIREDSYEDDCRGKEILDLQDCINGAASLPPLLPSVKALHDSGTRRVFRQAGRNLSNEGILVGYINTGSTIKEVRFPSSDRSRHCYIVGATGTGKSTLLYNMIRQDIENGEGVCVIDPHGDLHQQVLESIPKKRIEDVVLVDPCDFENAVGINFLECSGPLKSVQMNFITNEMVKIFDRLYDLRHTGGPIFEQYARNALFLCMDNDIGATLMDIPMVFEDIEYRKFLKSRCKSPIVVNFWSKQAEKAGGEASLENMAPYITSKLNQFTTNALLRPIIGQKKSTIDFRKIMDKRKILLVNLSKGLLGELDTQLLGMLIVGKIFSSAMGRVALKPEDRSPFFLYVDEFQNFTTDTVAHLLSEARKFGIYLTLANQNLSQLSAGSGRQNVLDAVLGNVGTALIFRIGAVDSPKMEIYTKPELLAHDLQDLPDFHVAGRILVKNSPSKPFVFETLPSHKEVKDNNKDIIIKISREKFSAPVKKVEEDIIAWRKNYEYLSSLKDFDI